MKNSSDKNEKVVQTKGGFSYMESERKALEDYLAQLAGDSKPKNSTTQAKTVIGVNNDTGNKVQDSAMIKPNENVIVKSFTENKQNTQAKPDVSEVKNFNTVVNTSNSFVPNSTNTNNISEVKNKNVIKSEIKPDNLPVTKTLIASEKKEAFTTLQPINKVDSIKRYSENNFKKDQDNQSDISSKKEERKVNDTIANKVQPATTPFNCFIPRNNISNATRNSFLTSSEPTKIPAVITVPIMENKYITSNTPNNNSILTKKNDETLNVNSEIGKDILESKDATKLIYNSNNIKKENVEDLQEKKDSSEQPNIIINNCSEKKNSVKLEQNVIKVNTQNEKKNFFIEPNTIDSNNSLIEKKNTHKEAKISLSEVNSQNSIENPIIKNSFIKNSQLTPAIQESANEILSQPTKVMENIIEKTKNTTSVQIPKIKPTSHSQSTVSVDADNKKKENSNDENPPITKIENKLQPLEKKNDSEEVSKFKPVLNENQENKITSTKANDKIIPINNQNLNSENRQSMFEMMNKLDLKLGGSRNSVIVESKVINQPINSSDSGKLDMSKKIQGLTKQMTGEDESSSTRTSLTTPNPIINSTNTSSILAVPSTIPNIPKVPPIPITIASVPAVPTISGSIPPIPGVPKVPGVPPVPSIPKIPAIKTKNDISLSNQSDSSTNSDCCLSISEQIAKGISLKKVQNNEAESKNENKIQFAEKRESKTNGNMFEEMKKVQLKKVNK